MQECYQWFNARTKDAIVLEVDHNGDSQWHIPMTNGLDLEINYCPWCGSPLDNQGCNQNKEETESFEDIEVPF